MLVKDWKDYIEKILQHLDNKSGKKEFKENIPKNGFDAKTRDGHLEFLKKIGFINLENPDAKKAQQQYTLTDNGEHYLEIDEVSRKCRFLHDALYSGIFWYNYAYNIILRESYYKFTKEELFEFLVENSSKDFGVRIYDRISFDNTFNCFKNLGVIELEDSDYYKISDEYKLKFDKDKFQKLVKRLLKETELELTKVICQKLINNYHEFYTGTKEELNIPLIFQKLIELYKEEKITFLGGLPKPPIPAAFTLLKWRD
ncbi:MAG: hypothetical protein WED07_12350 [Candidatus Freyarchaeum deiterrae]